MKRWQSILLTAALSLVLVAPAFGFGDTEVNTDIKNSKLQGAVGNGNIGIQTNGAVKDNTFNTGSTTVEGSSASANNNNMIGNTVFGDTFSPKAYGGDGGEGGDGGDATVKNSGNSVNTNGNATSLFGDANSGQIMENTGNTNQTAGDIDNTDVNVNGQQQQQANKQVLVIEDSEELLEIRDTWTLRELLDLAGSPSLDYQLRVLAYRSHRERLGHPKDGTKGMDLDTTIKLIVDKPSGKDLAMIRCVAEERDVDSVNVVALAAVDAIRHGASQLYITKADFERLMQADAWGIMFGGSGSIIKDSGMTGTGAVIAPGIGYGESESGYTGLPYVRAYAFE